MKSIQHASQVIEKPILPRTKSYDKRNQHHKICNECELSLGYQAISNKNISKLGKISVTRIYLSWERSR